MLNSKLMGDVGGSGDLGGVLLRPPRLTVGSLRDALYSARFHALLLISLFLACIATFRTFGFDLDETIESYPDVATGWGLWSWLADQGLGFSSFFFIVNFILALTVSVLAFPAAKEGHSKYRMVQIAILLYMTCWFLFGQTRYGSAIGLAVCAMGCQSLPIALVLCALAVLTHKAMAGGVILLLLWRALKHSKHGLLVAALVCGVLVYVVTRLPGTLLELSGYANYLNWELLPSSRTPYKFLYIGLLLLAFLLRAKSDEGKRIATEMLILTLLFIPFSLYLAFAGRAYQLYAVAVLTFLTHRSIPFVVRYLILSVYFFDVYMLVFRSGCFAASGCPAP